MGTKIVSWSPVHGQSTTTSNIAALAAHYALKHSNRSVITHTQLNYSSLESLFGKNKTSVKGFEDSGLIAIERLINSKLIKSDAVYDYTETVYAGRLDLLGGAYSYKEVTSEMIDTLLKAIETAYDIVWIDAHSGTRSDITTKTLENADIILVNLPANKFVLDHFFFEEFPKELNGKEVIYLISQYVNNTQFNIRKIKRMYNIKEAIFPVPFSTKFRDASNKSSITDFFYTRVGKENKSKETAEFVEALNTINKHIQKKVARTIGELVE